MEIVSAAPVRDVAEGSANKACYFTFYVLLRRKTVEVRLEEVGNSSAYGKNTYKCG